MFDLSKITELFGGLLSGQSQVPQDMAGITELLSNAGVDPALLDGLSQGEIFGLLQQHGIDPSLIDPAQISELLQGSGLADTVGGMAQSWLESRRG